MQLDERFSRLALRFDASRLLEEALSFGDADWRAHPQKFDGNSSIVLVSADGGINDDLDGPMRPTEFLTSSPYTRQVMAAFRTVIGRSRLMRITGGGNVPLHTDVGYYWHDRVRIHVPIVTDPAVRFYCEDESVHMAAGEAWVFDNWKQHHVENGSSAPRIHLVIDTVGTPTSGRWSAVPEGTLSRPTSRFVMSRSTPRPIRSWSLNRWELRW